jgi:cytochrome c biogenesis factor
LVLACIATVLKLVNSINKRSLRGTINGIAPHIVHLGVVFILIGFIGSNFFTTEEDITLTAGGPPQKVGEYDVVMTESAIESESAFATVEIYKDGEFIGTGRPGAVLIDGQNRNEISVLGTPTEDIYLVFMGGTQSGDSFSSVDLQVKVLPLMSVLWLGMWLVAAGIFMRLMVALFTPKKKVPPGRARRREALKDEREEEEEDEEMDEEEDLEAHETGGEIEPEAKERDYYEDLIERELEDMD